MTSKRQPAPPSRLHAHWMLSAILMGLALFCSGAAGLVNQVIWQRSLKVFLGGSETISSTIVVLVFMAGLGMGSVWMGNRAARLSNALKTVGFVEVLLAAANLAICALLSSNLSDSVFSVQQIAMSAGVPLWLVYAAGALVILLVPCLLMGATMPLAAEVCQKQLGLSHSRLLGLLFFINTLGSVLGTLVSSGFMIPKLGLSTSMICAALLNLAAGLFLLILSISVKSKPSQARDGFRQLASRQPRSLFRLSVEETLALGLGLCSLGYEMYLFRLIPLRHEPLPFTFAAVLAGFLLLWSLGAAASSRKRRLSLSVVLRICGLTTACSIPMFTLDSLMPIDDTWSLARFVLLKIVYFVPCFFFGYLFGLIARQAAKSWGQDIGRIYAYNTLGSCLGIILMTVIGYEIPFLVTVLAIGLLLFALSEYADAQEHRDQSRHQRRIPRWTYPAAASVIGVALSFVVDLSGIVPGMHLYYGRDGVIGVDDDGNMMWDGLWHSRMSIDNNHVGTGNWYLAVCPVFCHPTGKIEDVCIIGVATGMTASTLAKLDTVKRIDGYDINHTLKEIYSRYPEGTLRLADNRKIRIIWQDARSGLALNPKKYDIIQTQPLYLKQSGSSLLNSVEFYELISKRLNPGGVFCLYSNGTAEQAFVVRQTAAKVFPYIHTFHEGYLLVCANDRIALDEQVIAQKLKTTDPLWQEIRNWPETSSAQRIVSLLDRPPLRAGDGRLLTTDDHPIIEYPKFLADQVKLLGYEHELPIPGCIR